MTQTEWLCSSTESNRAQEFGEWLRDVRDRPDLYNFVHETQCCDCREPELVNDWERCQVCQDNLGPAY